MNKSEGIPNDKIQMSKQATATIQAVAFVLGPWTFFGHLSLVIRHSPTWTGGMRNELNRPSAPTTPPTVNATRTLRSQGGR